MTLKRPLPHGTSTARRTWLMAALRVAVSGALGAGLASALQARSAEAPALLLANPYGPHIDPRDYLVSEKYDGVRAHWDGRRLRTRSGRALAAPRWFLERLPSTQMLDGELWLGRGQFDALSGLVRTEQPDDAGWQRIRYMVFELPDTAGSFQDRVKQLSRLCDVIAWPALQCVPQRRVADRADLQRLLNETVAGGAEGLMLHLASAPYVTGRSDILVKLKPELDSEAVVVGHRPGRGKYVGLMGALEVETPDGRRFLLGSGFSDAQRRDPPALGTTVTYRYRSLTPAGLPRFANFLRVRDSL